MLPYQLLGWGGGGVVIESKLLKGPKHDLLVVDVINIAQRKSFRLQHCATHIHPLDKEINISCYVLQSLSFTSSSSKHCLVDLVLHIYFPTNFGSSLGHIFNLSRPHCPLFVGLCALWSGNVSTLFFTFSIFFDHICFKLVDSHKMCKEKFIF